jgi:hypothetical protein
MKPLTVDEMLRWATATVARHLDAPGTVDEVTLEVARSLRALFKTPLPCGWPTPRPVFEDGGRVLRVEWGGVGDFDADGARGIGTALILAAEGERR